MSRGSVFRSQSVIITGEAGTITIVFQTVGASTQRMVSLEQGDAFADFVGPLGCPSDLIDEDIEELKKKKDCVHRGRRRYRTGVSAGKVAA